PGVEARPAGDGACGAGGGEGERHTHLRDLPGAGGYGDSGEPAGETAGGDARQSVTAGGRGGGHPGGGEITGARGSAGIAVDADLFMRLVLCLLALPLLHAQDTRKVVEPQFPPACEVLTARLAANGGPTRRGCKRRSMAVRRAKRWN